MDDINLLEKFLSGGEKYFTREQRRIADINNDGIINVVDLVLSVNDILGL